MNTQIIDLVASETHVSKCNARAKKHVNGLASLATLMKDQGQLQPVIFRMEDGKPGILAGQRRRGSAILLEKDDPDFRLKAVEVDVDDAQAKAISLTENISQESMAEVDIWKSLAGLVKQGWTVTSIAQVYSIPEKKVRQLLALGECFAGVLVAYEREDINLSVLKLLAVSPKKKVSAWLKLYRSGKEYPAWHSAVQQFLFNNDKTFSTTVALFDVKESGLAVIEDMFEEDTVFADSNAFIEKQDEAVKAELTKLKESGWSDAVQVNSFYQWDYVECKKAEGGKVYAEIEYDGAAVFHKGFLTEKEYKRNQAKADTGQCGSSDSGVDEKPEITQAMHDYLLLYLTQAARTSVQHDTVLAKKVLIALLITRSGDLHLSNDHSFESVSKTNENEIEQTKAYKTYLGVRRDVLKSIKTKANWKMSYSDFDTVFKQVQKLDTKKLDSVLAVLTADLITVYCSANLAIINTSKPDLSKFWSAEQGGVFFKKIRNKNALLSIIGTEFDQNAVAQCESLKVTQIRDQLKSLTEKVKGWIPKYLNGGYYDSGKGTPFEK